MNTTRAPHQSAAAAAAVQPIDGNGNSPGQPIASAPESTLTAAELREKEYRRQQREAAEQERLHQHREVLERQHAAQQAAKRGAEQQSLLDIETREAAAKEYEASRAVEEERVRREEASRGAGVDERSWYQHRPARRSNRAENLIRRVDDNASSVDYDTSWRSSKPQQNPNITQNRRSAFTQHDRQTQQGEGFRIRYGSSKFGVKPNDPRTQQEFNNTRQPERMGMPEFSLNSRDQQTEGSLDGGWGSGSAEVQPLEYGEEEQRIARETALRSQGSTHRESPPSAASQTSTQLQTYFLALTSTLEIEVDNLALVATAGEGLVSTKTTSGLPSKQAIRLHHLLHPADM